jgi:hypothetical protein
LAGGAAATPWPIDGRRLLYQAREYRDVLARRAAHNRGRGVPVVRGRNEQRINRLVVQDAAKILHALRLLFLLVAHRLAHAIEHVFIDVADVGNLAVRLRHEALGQRSAAAVHAHDPDLYLLAQRLAFLRATLRDKIRSGSKRSTGSSGCLNERTAVDRVRHGKAPSK